MRRNLIEEGEDLQETIGEMPSTFLWGILITGGVLALILYIIH